MKWLKKSKKIEIRHEIKDGEKNVWHDSPFKRYMSVTMNEQSNYKTSEITHDCTIY